VTKYFQTIHAGHALIEQHDIPTCPVAIKVQALLTISSFTNFMAGSFQC
jgi:hypothetical protein